MTTRATSLRNRSARGLPLSSLREGDRLTQPEFHCRYLMTPDGVKAELVEGVVYIASRIGARHGRSQAILAGVFGNYEAVTTGVEAFDNATLILGPQSEPQTDLQLRLLPEYGGRKGVEQDILVGPSEQVAEVSHSTETLDLNAKRRDYDRARVTEYLVLLVGRGALRAFGPGGVELPVDADGVFRSKVFPGLWVDAASVAEGNLRRALRTLDKGLKSPEHTAFVRRLKAGAAGAAKAPKLTPRKQPGSRRKPASD